MGMFQSPNIPRPVAPPPPPDTTGAMLRELAKAQTDQQLRAGRGRKNAFLTADAPAQGTTFQPGMKLKLGQ